MLRAASTLLACLVCLSAGTVAAVAIAAPGHRSPASHAAHACRHHAQPSPLPVPPQAQAGLGFKALRAEGRLQGRGLFGHLHRPVDRRPGPGDSRRGLRLWLVPRFLGRQAALRPTETPAAPARPVHVQVTAEDTNGYHFILSRTSVPAGPVVIEFVNHGQDEHNLHAVEQPAESTEAGGLKENVKPDAHTDLTLNLHAGSYTLFCSLPGHEAKGMKATLTVE